MMIDCDIKNGTCCDQQQAPVTITVIHIINNCITQFRSCQELFSGTLKIDFKRG